MKSIILVMNENVNGLFACRHQLLFKYVKYRLFRKTQESLLVENVTLRH